LKKSKVATLSLFVIPCETCPRESGEQESRRKITQFEFDVSEKRCLLLFFNSLLHTFTLNIYALHVFH